MKNSDSFREIPKAIEKIKLEIPIEYSIDCAGDVVKGDDICFAEAIFGGSFRNPYFNHLNLVIGKVVNDSYGKDKQQHTFTIMLLDGSKKLKKGRNVYRNFCFRKKWEDESLRIKIADEKHERGNKARDDRFLRKLYMINA